jgi:hypothetical protein
MPARLSDQRLLIRVARAGDSQTWYSDNTALATAITNILTATYAAAGNRTVVETQKGTQRSSLCAVQRRWFSVGANPTRQFGHSSR